MKHWLPIALACVSALLLGYAIFFWPNDEEKIRARLDELSEALRQTESETNVVVRGARIHGAFSDIFTKEVSVRAPELGPLGSSRKELAATAASTGARFRTADVSFDAVQIALDPGKQHADVTSTATLTALEHGGGMRRDTREVELDFEKVDGDWRIVAIVVRRAEAD